MRAFRPVPASHREQLEADVRSAIERIEKDVWARGELAKMPKGRRHRERKALERMLLPMVVVDAQATGEVQVLFNEVSQEMSR